MMTPKFFQKVSAVKGYLTDKYQEYYPYLHLTYDSVRAINSLFERETITPLTYIETGINIKLIYDRFEQNLGNRVKIHPFHKLNGWVRICKVPEIETIIYSILTSCQETVKIRVDSDDSDDDKDKVVYYSYRDIEFAVCVRRDEILNLYVRDQSRVEELRVVINEKAWEKIGSNHVRYDHKKRRLLPEEVSETFATDISERVAADLDDYIRHNYSRSILFYGPPGSGKSNLIKHIYLNSKYKSLRINISNLEDEVVMNLISLFQPTIIVIDDIDHGIRNGSNIDSILKSLEGIHTNTKAMLASANVVTKLDPALQRPGRFDELVEIKCLDRKVHMSLVDQDEELFQFTTDFPAAYILEFMKRVRVKGKAYALANSKDITSRVKNLENYNYGLEMDDEDYDLDDE
jgi:hypothetical protein